VMDFVITPKSFCSFFY